MTTSPQPRAAVSQIPTYVARQAAGAAPGPDDVQGVVEREPVPPAARSRRGRHERGADHEPLPGHEQRGAVRRARRKLGVPTGDIALATGSVALIYQLVQAFCDPDDEVVFAWRSFEAYPIAVTAAAARMVRVPVLGDGRHDLDAMAAAVTDRTKVVLVCTPNNPTGPAVTQAELDAFLAKVPKHVLVVVDEAYVEFVRMADAIDGVATYQRHDNVLLTRTFSKAYGLAGFRVGYAVGPAPLAGALRAVSLPFGVSGRRAGRRPRLPRPRARAAGAGRGARRRARPRRSRPRRRRLAGARPAGQLRLVRAG